MKKKQRVLVLAPHVDDGELGCGGSLARLCEERTEVFYVAFTVPSGVTKEHIDKEAKNSCSKLGIKHSNYAILDFKVRYLPLQRQEVLEKMIELNRELSPDTIFLPSMDDLHQDHQVVAREGFRAFKYCSIVGWEQPWNNIRNSSIYFIGLQERHVDKKIEACKCFRSQADDKHFFDEKFLRGIARMRGAQIKQDYAESFEVYRWIER